MAQGEEEEVEIFDLNLFFWSSKNQISRSFFRCFFVILGLSFFLSSQQRNESSNFNFFFHFSLYFSLYSLLLTAQLIPHTYHNDRVPSHH